MRPTEQEIAQRAAVVGRLIEAIRAEVPILFPQMGQSSSFGGTVGAYAYVFEGEDDLLHLQIERTDGAELTIEYARTVAAFVLSNVSPSLYWMKPAPTSCHFYIGHDDLLSSID